MKRKKRARDLIHEIVSEDIFFGSARRPDVIIPDSFSFWLRFATTTTTTPASLSQPFFASPGGSCQFGTHTRKHTSLGCALQLGKQSTTTTTTTAVAKKKGKLEKKNILLFNFSPLFLLPLARACPAAAKQALRRAGSTAGRMDEARRKKVRRRRRRVIACRSLISRPARASLVANCEPIGASICRLGASLAAAAAAPNKAQKRVPPRRRRRRRRSC